MCHFSKFQPALSLPLSDTGLPEIPGWAWSRLSPVPGAGSMIHVPGPGSMIHVPGPSSMIHVPGPCSRMNLGGSVGALGPILFTDGFRGIGRGLGAHLEAEGRHFGGVWGRSPPTKCRGSGGEAPRNLGPIWAHGGPRCYPLWGGLSDYLMPHWPYLGSPA